MPTPILSLFFSHHPYIPYFLIQRFFFSLLPFLLHACMYSHQVSNSNCGLALKIGLLLGQSWMMNKQLCPEVSSFVIYYEDCLHVYYIF